MTDTLKTIQELKLKRLALLTEYADDRMNPKCLKEEKAILMQIEQLSKTMEK